MYKKNKLLTGKMSDSIAVTNFIEGFDVFNSELLRRIDLIDEYEEYIITKNPYRIDLISLELYRSIDYSPYILYYNRMTLEDLIVGSKIKYIKKEILDNLIDNL